MRLEVCRLNVILCPVVKQRVEINTNPYTILRNVPKVHWSSIFSPLLSPHSPPSLSLSPPSLLCFFYKPTSTVYYTWHHTAEHWVAQTAPDKVRMIHILLFAGSELWQNIELCYAQCFSLSLDEILGLTLESALKQIFE